MTTRPAGLARLPMVVEPNFRLADDQSVLSPVPSRWLGSIRTPLGAAMRRCGEPLDPRLSALYRRTRRWSEIPFVRPSVHSTRHGRMSLRRDSIPSRNRSPPPIGAGGTGSTWVPASSSSDLTDALMGDATFRRAPGAECSQWPAGVVAGGLRSVPAWWECAGQCGGVDADQGPAH